MRTDNNAASDGPTPPLRMTPGLGARMVSHEVTQGPVDAGGAVDQSSLPTGVYR